MKKNLNIRKHLSGLKIEWYKVAFWQGHGHPEYRVRLFDPNLTEVGIGVSAGSLCFSLDDINVYGSKMIYFLLIVDAFQYKTKNEYWKFLSIPDHLWQEDWSDSIK